MFSLSALTTEYAALVSALVGLVKASVGTAAAAAAESCLYSSVTSKKPSLVMI